jgi:hypothetical protein
VEGKIGKNREGSERAGEGPVVISAVGGKPKFCSHDVR